MARLLIPSAADTPERSKALLDTVKRQLGVVPNMMKLLGSSPAAFEGYLSLSGALAKGALDAKLRESVALAVSQINGCDYCLAAHSYVGKHLSRLDDDAIAQARSGRSGDPQRDAALRFAQRVAVERGRIADGDITELRDAGFSDAEAIEIVANVALTVLTNYVNNVAHTEVDFPLHTTR